MTLSISGIPICHKMHCKDIPTTSVSVNASVAACIDIHCDAGNGGGGNQFPSVTVYFNEIQSATAADTQCGLSINYLNYKDIQDYYYYNHRK